MDKPIKAIKENIAPVGVREWAVREGGDITDRLFPNASFEERGRISNEIAPALQAVFDFQQQFISRLRSELAAANERAKASQQVLRDIEGATSDCPLCRGERALTRCGPDNDPYPYQHDPDCRLAAALTPPSEPGSTGGTAP